ncbi:hypothetical protein OKW43_003290 [Paraburkholderia sp. WC7.3g]
MRFYPMLAGWLEFARSDGILETTLQHAPDSGVAYPRSSVPPRFATRGLTFRRARFTTTDRLATFQAPRSGPFAA